MHNVSDPYPAHAMAREDQTAISETIIRAPGVEAVAVCAAAAPIYIPPSSSSNLFSPAQLTPGTRAALSGDALWNYLGALDPRI